MEAKSLSLSKKLDGGYLHVKKRDSNVKSRVGKRGGYSSYLNKHSHTNKIQGGACNKGGKGNQKVVAIKLGGSKKKQKGKKKTDVKDISASSIIPKKDSVVHKKQSVNVQPIKVQPIKVKPIKVQPKGIPIVMPKTKGSLKKSTIVRRRSSGKSRGRSLTKRRTHDLKKGGKRISVSKIRHLSKKDVNNIQSKLKSIKGKSTEEIKKELDKQGIHVSGKSPSILKDIYMYSQLCGINIKRE